MKIHRPAYDTDANMTPEFARFVDALDAALLAWGHDRGEFDADVAQTEYEAGWTPDTAAWRLVASIGEEV